MTIVYYTDQIYLHGGLERVLTNKLNYFSKNTSIELHLITFQQGNNKPCYPLSNKVHLHDLAINYNRQKSFLHPLNIKHTFKHYKRLKQTLRIIKPSVIVVCNYEYGYYMVPLIIKKGIKVKEYHSSRFFNYTQRQKNKNPLKKINYWLSDFFESKYNYLALLTSDELQYYKSNNKIVIPNSIVTINKPSAELDKKRAIAAGRIAPVKGFEYLIRAWYIVNKSLPDWQLDIYGNGDEKYIKKTQRLIDDLELTDVVFLKGATQDLNQEMLESSMYIMSSLTECFPMVLLEAMNCGLPIISFDCPNGPRHIVTNQIDGIIVEHLNSKELALAIIEIARNKPKRIKFGKNAKQNVLRFSESEIMPEWLKYFN